MPGSAGCASSDCANPGEDGLELLRRAVELAGRGPTRLEGIRALVDFGAALRRGNQRAAAREPLQTAADLALLGGATALHGPRAHRTGRRRGAAAPHRASLRSRFADPERAADRRARGGRAQQPRDLADPVRHPEDGRVSPAQRVPQARNRVAARAAPGARQPVAELVDREAEAYRVGLAATDGGHQGRVVAPACEWRALDGAVEAEADLAGVLVRREGAVRDGAAVRATG